MLNYFYIHNDIIILLPLSDIFSLIGLHKHLNLWSRLAEQTGIPLRGVIRVSKLVDKRWLFISGGFGSVVGVLVIYYNS